jgi:hypothetical protein
MSTTPVIQDFRLSFVWNETLLGLMTGALQPQPAYTFLTQNSSYTQTFDTAQQGSNLLGLTVPWNERRQHFWNFYLPGSAGGLVSARQAWEYSVPLRSKLPFTIDRSQKEQAILEGYYFPHALAVVCTFRCRGHFSPGEVRELAYSIRYNERFTVSILGAPQQLTLSAVANMALNLLRTMAVKPANSPGTRREPWTLLTVIKAVGSDPKQPFAEHDEVHRMLEGVTRWPPDPDTATLTPVAEAGLETKTGTAKGSVHYAADRGRAIWFPGLFSLQKRRVCSLSCYHRNILMGAMQIDSLGTLVAGTAALLRNGTRLYELSAVHKARARKACDCLERFFTGDKRLTYRSKSFKEQVLRNELADLNDLRKAFSPGVEDLK